MLFLFDIFYVYSLYYYKYFVNISYLTCFNSKNNYVVSANENCNIIKEMKNLLSKKLLYIIFWNNFIIKKYGNGL